MMTDDKKTILIVDDNRDTLDILTLVLEGAGRLVEKCSDGEAVIKTAERCMPALILLDLMLPKVDGIEVSRRLRAHPSLKNTPIVIVTARSDREAREAARLGGADDYILKPFDPIQLLEKAREIVEKSRASSNPLSK